MSLRIELHEADDGLLFLTDGSRTVLVPPNTEDLFFAAADAFDRLGPDYIEGALPVLCHLVAWRNGADVGIVAHPGPAARRFITGHERDRSDEELEHAAATGAP